jgi:hypothetical protein
MNIKSVLGAGTIAVGLVVLGGTGTAVAGDLINSADIKNNSIKGTDLRDESVTGTDVGNGTLTGADIADQSLTSADLANNAVTGAEIGDGSIQSGDLAPSVSTWIEQQIAGVKTSVDLEYPASNTPQFTPSDVSVVTITATTNGAQDTLVQIKQYGTTTVMQCLAPASTLGVSTCSATQTMAPVDHVITVTGGSAKVRVVGVKTVMQ